MNREIKFRGKGHREWFYGYVQEYHEKFCKRICVCPVSIRTWKDALMYEVKEETIGQFTGLIDKNGKEVYEGDILGSVQFEDIVMFVAYDEEEASFIAVLINKNIGTELETRCHITQEWLDKRPKVVIGNIHDNPELLEDKK